MGANGKMCCVVGCKSTTRDKDKHFFRFPKDEQLKDVWMYFTRRGDDFTVKFHVICEFHFDPSCIIVMKSKVRLKSGSVPTIFERDTRKGRERVVVRFDKDLVSYIDNRNFLFPAYDKDKHAEQLIQEQTKRMDEVKSFCRFCLEDKTQDNESHISISKLENYYIKLDEVFDIVGLERKYDCIFGGEICEECFQHIITFDGFRKRCRKAHKAVLSDLIELDKKAYSVSGSATKYTEFFNESVVEKEVTEEENHELEWQDDQSEQFVESFEVEKVNSLIKQEESVEIKEEFEEELISDSYDEHYELPTIETLDDSCYIPPSSPQDLQIQEPEVETNGGAKNDTDEDFEWKEPNVSNNVIIRWKKPTPSKQKRIESFPENKSQYYATRIYECWFCHVKFAGKKTYKDHECPVKQVKCPVEKCEKVFKQMSAFNQHIIHLHKLPRILRQHCKICKLTVVLTEQEFKSHLRKCEINSNNLASSHSVKCGVCSKVCPNIQSYSIHVLFHEPSAPKRNNDSKNEGKSICEICGRAFDNHRYLLHHIKRVHSKPLDNPVIYTCDHCGKTRTSRSVLSKHIRNVHRSEPTPCGICGKVFRNKALMQAHMIYHKDSKRIHFCRLCPDKAPYVTAVALRRHQESNHGYGPGYRCDICQVILRTKAGLKQHSSVHKKQTQTSAMIM